MISVDQLSSIVLNNKITSKTTLVPFQQSVGYVLAENIYADRNFPPFDRVAMDGIAILFEEFEKGKKSFNVETIIAAGDPIYNLNDTSSCVEIMTGACMPNGLDTVIRYEDITVEDGIATIHIDNIRPKQNIHFEAMDNKKGDLLLEKDQLIKSVDLSLLATVGKSDILIYQAIKMAIISSGDELVEVHKTPADHQIRRSNVYVVKAMVEPYKIIPDLFHLKDNVDNITQQLTTILENYDVVTLIGGVSKGKYDYIPEVLTQLGVDKLAYRVAQRPGKPFWFGRKNNTIIFAMPGNPVSSMVCTRRYFIPWLRQHFYLNPYDPIYASLSETFNFKPSLTRFLEVSISYEPSGKVIATPRTGNGSGDFTKLGISHGFIELPAEKSSFLPEDVYPVYLF